MLHSICQQIWKTQQWPQDWKRSVFISIPKKGNAKECSNYHTMALISHTSKVMLKILPARLQQYVNQELPDVQAELGKGTRTRDQIANICCIIEKAREFQKNIYFFFIDYNKAFDCVQFSSATQSCPTLCDPMNRSTSGLPVHHQLLDSLRLTSIELVMLSSHLILSRPLLLLPPIPPSIRVFSNESTLHQVAKILELQL